MNKKNIRVFVFICLILLSLTGCSSNSSRHTADECPEVFSDGQQDAIEKIQYSAELNWDVYYVDLESLMDVIENKYGEDAAYEIRDSLDLYNPSDIVNDLIDDYRWGK